MIDWSQEILEYNTSKYRTPKEFAESKPYSYSTMYKQAKKIGMPLKTSSRVKPVTLSTKDVNCIEGHLLGDGSIYYLKPNRANPVFSMVSKHKEYIEWVNQTINLLADRPIWDREIFDNRTQKQYTSYWSRSLSKPVIKELHNKWYSNGVKVIPQNLQLSPELCLRWFIDDGSRLRGAINLATDCFQKHEVEFLASLYHSINIHPTLHKNGNGYRMYINVNDAKIFMDYIGQCPVKCFEYKW